MFLLQTICSVKRRNTSRLPTTWTRPSLNSQATKSSKELFSENRKKMSNRTKIKNSGFMKISGASSVFFCCVLSAFLCQHFNNLLLQVFPDCCFFYTSSLPCQGSSLCWDCVNKGWLTQVVSLLLYLIQRISNKILVINSFIQVVFIVVN